VRERCGPAGDLPGPAGPGGELNRALIMLARAHRNAAALRLAKLGLHPGQELLMFRVWAAGDDGVKPSELAATLCVEPPTVTKMLGRLEQAGLVRREPSPHDRRAVVVRPTEVGTALQSAVEAVWVDLEEATLAGLDDEDRERLLALLRHCETNLARPDQDGQATVAELDVASTPGA
jgi:DNA-binding MarR family transcriptional regulator